MTKVYTVQKCKKEIFNCTGIYRVLPTYCNSPCISQTKTALVSRMILTLYCLGMTDGTFSHDFPAFYTHVYVYFNVNNKPSKLKLSYKISENTTFCHIKGRYSLTRISLFFRKRTFSYKLGIVFNLINARIPV